MRSRLLSACLLFAVCPVAAGDDLPRDVFRILPISEKSQYNFRVIPQESPVPTETHFEPKPAPPEEAPKETSRATATQGATFIKPATMPRPPCPPGVGWHWSEAGGYWFRYGSVIPVVPLAPMQYGGC